MYDPLLGRFSSADSIVPGGVQGLDRYAYVNNSPVNFTDPTGHMCSDPEDTWSQMCDGADHQGESSQSGSGSSGNGGGGGNDDSDPSDGEGGLPGGSGPCSGPGCPIGSPVPPGPSCIAVSYCFMYPELSEPYPSWPDYIAIEGGVPIPHLWIFGGDFVFTFDKYGRIYFGIGPSGGTSPALGLDFNLSLSGGYIEDNNTTREEAHSFISEWSGGGCIGSGPGYCRVTGDPFDGHNTWANQYGLFTPQAGAALPYSGQIYP